MTLTPPTYALIGLAALIGCLVAVRPRARRIAPGSAPPLYAFVHVAMLLAISVAVFSPRDCK